MNRLSCGSLWFFLGMPVSEMNRLSGGSLCGFFFGMPVSEMNRLSGGSLCGIFLGMPVSQITVYLVAHQAHETRQWQETIQINSN